MYSGIKYQRVNWQDGMKISKEHFLQMEHAMEDQVRAMSRTCLNNFNYGLLHSGPDVKQSLAIQVFYDSSAQITVQVSECRAITPGGARIEILKGSSLVETTLHHQGLVSSTYEIFLVVHPYQRIPFGTPDVQEVPLRQPHATLEYRLEIHPYPHTHQPEYENFHICIGRLKVEGQDVKLSEHYIPPCHTVLSHPRLIASHNKLLSHLGEAEVAATGIMQRLLAKREKTSLDQSLLFFTDKLLSYTGHSLDNFRILYTQQSPINIVTYFISLGRVLNIGLNSLLRKDKEVLLDHFHKWAILSPREMENMLRSLLILTYDHGDAFSSINKVEAFAEKLAGLLKKLNELNHTEVPLLKDKVYGWLVLHTEGKERTIFKMESKTVIIGRNEIDQSESDYFLTDDSTVSRRHAKIAIVEEMGAGGVHLSDLNSANGTYIHATQTILKSNDPFSLIHGDTFQVGKTNIVFFSFSGAGSEAEVMKELENIPFMKVENLADMLQV